MPTPFDAHPKMPSVQYVTTTEFSPRLSINLHLVQFITSYDKFKSSVALLKINDPFFNFGIIPKKIQQARFSHLDHWSKEQKILAASDSMW